MNKSHGLYLVCMINLSLIKWYLLDGGIIDDYGHRLSHVSQATLFQGMTEFGETFLLPVSEPWNNCPESWRNSLFEITEHAKEEWVKISPNHTEKCYEH